MAWADRHRVPVRHGGADEINPSGNPTGFSNLHSPEIARLRSSRSGANHLNIALARSKRPTISVVSRR